MHLKRNTGDGKKISSDRKPNRTSNIMKKAAITAVLASSFTFNIGFAKDNEESQLQKIFHIYASGEYVGTVSDEKAVKELVDEKITESSSQYDDLKLSGSNLSIISEQVFNSETNDAKTLEKLDKLVTVAADAFALSVNDEIAVYVKDLESYHEVVRKLKLQTVTEKELTELEARKDSTDSLPPLKNNETRILDINIKESISGVTKQAKPEKILTVDEAVEYLQKGVLEEKTYTVQSGDVFSKIAASHNLTTAELSKLNKGTNENSSLQIGEKLKVTALKPLVNIEVVREKKVTEAVQFENQVRESKDMLKGDTKVIQEGSNGAKELTYVIREQNGTRVGKSIKNEAVVKDVKNNIVLKGIKVIPSRGSGKFAWPAEGGYISSEMGQRWGRMHRGIDIARPSGFAIKAADNGVVKFAGTDGSFGNKVIIDHKNGYETLYAHLASINVSVGQTVPVGAKIGVMGSTGRSTGTHLHFEVEHNGVNVNPLKYLER
ncbi:M23 family metallopeptidase [Paenisporosarcina quisquiliarum]|uniref:M23 family metallopeptidase n=1 Tax=Paenisporosarcina quisquiliarum TaxID=365346 RepID=A0A9X3RE89_9BACL|nr:M23 family metallopeptidase [Paenisporosarcina quisquiliarum]MCZ8538381.1 M23 family metallopeptidase [Paenisporosarcina quisquiliarum]